jgi:hypothetical protein
MVSMARLVFHLFLWGLAWNSSHSYTLSLSQYMTGLTHLEALYLLTMVSLLLQLPVDSYGFPSGCCQTLVEGPPGVIIRNKPD